MALSREDFEYVRRLVLDRSGVVIDADRAYFVDSRLDSLATERGLASAALLVGELRKAPAAELSFGVIEAMMVHETSFFRDIAVFEAFKKTILPELLSGSPRMLRIWCAACATGQEPYSVAMLLRDHFAGALSDIEILASDLSATMVTRARAATYSTLEVNRGLPAALLVRYFEQHGREWTLKEDLRKMVTVRRMNLMDETAWSEPPVDVLFLRNVLIYFDPAMKKRILARAWHALKPKAFLVLGGSETTIGLDARFEPIHLEKCTWHRRKDAY